MTVDDVVRNLVRRQTHILLGESGIGKTHIARHVALALARSGHVPISIRCADYIDGHLDDLLARSIAPFTIDNSREFLLSVSEIGREIILVLDGWNECPEEARRRLVEEVSAFRLQYPGGTLVTSQAPVSLPESLSGTGIAVRPPTSSQRNALLLSYGITDGSRVSPAFTTAYELSVAAECDDDLDDQSTRHDLIDAYIRRFARNETTRTALRALAAAMTSELRLSLPLIHATGVLERDAHLTSHDIDEALANPLVESRQGRVRFRHEIIGRFLAAEGIVRAAPDAQALATSLREPRHRDLSEYAIAIEHDGERRAAALSYLADAPLYLESALGALGLATRLEVENRVSAVLEKARSATSFDKAVATGDPETYPGARWEVDEAWTSDELALLTAAGTALWHGLFTHDIAGLMDETDKLCSANEERVRSGGIPDPSSTLVHATYAGAFDLDSRGLGASVVAGGCYSHRHLHRRQRAASIMPQLLEGATVVSWGRLYLAAIVASPEHPQDRGCLPELLRLAWASRAYHVRLEALWAAQQFVSYLDGPSTQRVRDLLERFTTRNIMLSTALIDTMASYQMVEPANDLPALREAIKAVISKENDPVAQDEAMTIVSRQFEEEAIYGPYVEAVDSLPPRDKTTLLVMAANAPTPVWMHRDWVLEELADRAGAGDPRVVAVLKDELADLRTGGPALQGGIADHLAVVRGWASIAAELPESPTVESLDDLAWRTVDALIVSTLRGDFDSSERYWKRLTEDYSPAAIDVFYRLNWCNVLERATPGVHEKLIKTYPQQFRRLFTWGLGNLGALTSKFSFPDRHDRSKYVVNTLGHVGDASTAALLRPYAFDEHLGDAAVASIRLIEERNG